MKKYKQKRHSDKKMQPIVIELLKHKFIRKNEVYLFSHWRYKAGVLNFLFCMEKDKDKDPLRDEIPLLCNILFNQHWNDYQDTLKINFEAFDKVIKMEEKSNG